MYLKRLTIKNFRCIKNATIDFNEGVNILIGENNSGKTAILDALRICLCYGKQRRDIYISLNDFHVDKNNPASESGDIEFNLYFEIQQDVETGIYLDFLSVRDDGHQELKLNFRYFIEERNGNKRVKYRVWGGDNEGQLITPEVLDLIYFVHLDALRDAVRYLKPVRGNRLGELYAKIITDENEQEALTKKVRSALNKDREWHELISKGKTKVNEHLHETTIYGKEQRVEIDFLPLEFRKIIDNLRVQIPVFDDDILENQAEQKYFDLYQNGLGYNNLIYIAIVLGDLKRMKELYNEAYVSLLIEEPEAHLHPQLQNIFFNYLNKLNKFGFQIFVTSHSPTITAKAALDSLIVLQEKEKQIDTFSLKKSNLNNSNKKYLQKFLDVTKSQLFFSNGVILVEGISEALLLPVFSKIMGNEYDIEKKGIEIVNLGGVAFEHFAKLFNSENPSERLSSRCAILTDDDRTDNKEISSRAEKAKGFQNGQLRVELAEKTFEYTLFKAGLNREILFEIFREMHQVASTRIESGTSLDEYAYNFLIKVESNKAKSELSHRLALRLENDTDAFTRFTVPEYIKNAIRWVTKGE